MKKDPELEKAKIEVIENLETIRILLDQCVNQVQLRTTCNKK